MDGWGITVLAIDDWDSQQDGRRSGRKEVKETDRSTVTPLGTKTPTQRYEHREKEMARRRQDGVG